MFYQYKLWSITLLFVLSIFSTATAQKNKSIWSEVSVSKLQNDLRWSRKSDPVHASYYELDLASLKNQLSGAPQRGSTSSLSTTIIEYPTSKGMELFRVKEASVMHPQLQAKYPDFKSYIGQGINEPTNQIRFSITSQGFHGMMFSPKYGLQFVDSYTLDNSSVIVYEKSDLVDGGERWECHTEDDQGLNQRIVGPVSPVKLKNANDGVLRNFRLAISTTIEYSDFHWMRAGIAANASDADKRMAVMAAMIVTMTRNNFIYERDLSITMTFVANNDILISLGSDNFSNNNAGALLGENQTAIDNAIGFSNYDIGHIFTTGGGGVASLASPCTNRKAQGVTGRAAPIGDPYDIDFVAHEIGHQMGAPHTFNGNVQTCATQRSSNNAFEPGSGTTIMAYAGICAPQNVQNNSDAYFHAGSLEDIFNNVSAGLSTCSQQTATGNTAPVATVDATLYTIPRSTPYKLSGTSSDVDGISTHTYTWEQYDLSSITGLPEETNVTGPMVRSFEGTSSKVRYIPRLEDIVDNGGVSTEWEKLSSVSRSHNFRLTVRDNDTRGGQSDFDTMFVSVNASAGPFRVTSQSTSGIVWVPNTVETITWDVAGTTGNNINASNVNILLSIDGGLNFDTILASNVPNNGSYDLTVPSGIVATNCRVMVEGSGNIFFNINDEDFNINAQVSTVCNTYSSGTITLPIPDGTGTSGPVPGSAVTDVISIPDNTVIEDININVNINHPFIQDLVFEVSDPSGNTVRLWQLNCGGNDSLNITFEDGAPAVICSDPTVGTYESFAPLAPFEGNAANGDWTIALADFFATDTGFLNSWTIEICTSTVTPLSNESFELDNLSIYPNPNNGQFHIEFENASTDEVGIQIFDLSGRSVFSQSYETTSSFNQNIKLNTVSSGMYLVNIVDGDRTITKKIVIE
jgi:subtilisin-like proprotein convertase family protein